MALIDIPTRVEAYIATHQGLTPPCFAVALDVVTDGHGIAYEEFEKRFPPLGGVNFEESADVLAEYVPDNVWPYSPALVHLLSSTKATGINLHVTERAAARLFEDVAGAALIICEPGSSPMINHARAITPAQPGKAIIWNSQNNPLIRVVRKPELKRTLVDCLAQPESSLFAIGFNLLLQDLLSE